MATSEASKYPQATPIENSSGGPMFQAQQVEGPSKATETVLRIAWNIPSTPSAADACALGQN